jgi:DNA-binding transcriptional regulator YhcF (GntR family)
MIPYDLIADVALMRIQNPTAKVVLIALARYSNAKGECFPSRDRLSADTSISVRSIVRSIQWLEANNYIRIRQRSGSSNFYVITSMEEETMSDSDNTPQTRAKLAHEDDITNNIYSINSSNSNTTTRAKLAHPLNTPMFAAFWQAYPRKIGKGAARVAFDKSLKFAHGNDIIQAAIDFSKHCREMQTEPQFIPHASTWLNQERWEDDLSAEMPDKKSGWGDALNEL